MVDEALEIVNIQHSRTCAFHALQGRRTGVEQTRRKMVNEPKTLTGVKQVLTYTVLGHKITRELPACHPLQLISGVYHGSLSISSRNNGMTLY